MILRARHPDPGEDAMIDAQVRPKSYLRLMSLVALLGIVSAALSFVLMALVHEGTYLIWEQAQVRIGLDARLFTILLCTGAATYGTLHPATGTSRDRAGDRRCGYGQRLTDCLPGAA